MTDNKDLISVIVPIYGIERYVGTCIESLINQTYKDLEIILVDDGSPDRCSEICDLYSKKDCRIKVIHKENGGLVSARKAGIKAATGVFIGNVDGDDWVAPRFYESLYKAIKVSEADAVCAGMSRDLFTKKKTFKNCLPCGVYKGEGLNGLFLNMISSGNFYQPGIMTYVWNKLFKRNVIEAAQLNVDERISNGEDAAVTYPALMNCRKVAVIDNCEYHYRQREDSMLKKITSFDVDAEKLMSLYCYLNNYTDSIQNERFRQSLKTQIIDYVLSICLIRSGGIVGTDYMPFGADLRGKRVAVYSAGTFGQQLMNRLKECDYCEIVAWLDDDYWEYRRCCMDVDPVGSIVGLDYDYLLIATVNEHMAMEIKKRLQVIGVSEKKIRTIWCPKEIRRDLLKQYLEVGI